MYVRRDCLDQTGLLDADAFPRGYGEENDWCMRAGFLDWEHVIDDATVIYHVRAASFGAAKGELLAQGRRIIDERYPNYSREVGQAFSSRAVQRARRRIQQVVDALQTKSALVKPRLLYVVHKRSWETDKKLLETRILPLWGERIISEIHRDEVEELQATFIRVGYKSSTVNPLPGPGQVCLLPGRALGGD
jgi:GT2 family glycosyltransferase